MQSRINYCNAVLRGISTGTIQKLSKSRPTHFVLVIQVSRWSRSKTLQHYTFWFSVPSIWTYCYLQSWSVTLLNPDLKHLYLSRLSQNIDLTCYQHLQSYDHMMLYKFDYFNYYIIIQLLYNIHVKFNRFINLCWIQVLDCWWQTSG